MTGRAVLILYLLGFVSGVYCWQAYETNFYQYRLMSTKYTDPLKPYDHFVFISGHLYHLQDGTFMDKR